MLEITVKRKEPEVINLEDVNVGDWPILVRRDGEFIGMVIKESSGWVVKVDARCGAYGSHPFLRELIELGIKDGYTFHVND